jgi:hypothetical protein
MKDQVYDCGIHSEIPLCCIKFFMRSSTLQESQAYRDRIQQVAKEHGFEGFGYVPCPDCLAKAQPVPLKLCNCWGFHPDLDCTANDYWYCKNCIHSCNEIVSERNSLCIKCQNEKPTDLR